MNETAKHDRSGCKCCDICKAKCICEVCVENMEHKIDQCNLYVFVMFSL